MDDLTDWRRLGRIVRLQIQSASLKVGEKPDRRFGPSPIQPVSKIHLTADGVVAAGESGEAVIDVHHRDHPRSRHRDGNGLSLGFTSHYRAMRERFGPHLVDGIAGENVLVEVDHRVDVSDLSAGLAILTTAGNAIPLNRVLVAEPCVEFSRFALGGDRSPDDPSIGDALAFLRHGTRGFYVSYEGPPVTVRVGDWLVRSRAAPC